jgi:hypothetical protein
MDVEGEELLSLAIADVLAERERRMFELRYGLVDGECRTLAEVGSEFALSRERIRQLMKRSIRRLKSRAGGRLRAGDITHPCASMKLYFESKIDKDAPDLVDQLCALLRDEPRTRRQLFAELIFNKSTAATHLKTFTERDRAYAAAQFAEVKSERALAAARRLLAQSVWPENVTRVSKLPMTVRAREVSSESVGSWGVFFSTKMGRNVQFESALEYRFLQFLERLPEVDAYQEQPLAVPYTLGARQRTYYPDVCLLMEGRVVMVEIKPRAHFALRDNLVKWASLREYCTIHGYGLLITDSQRAFQSVWRRSVPEPLREAVNLAIRDGSVSWPDYKFIRDTSGTIFDDFQAMILQERLVWTLSPFRVTRP